MMILLGLIQLGLLLVLLVIVRMLFAMVRSGAPLFSLPSWKVGPLSRSTDPAGRESTRLDEGLAKSDTQRPDGVAQRISFRLPLLRRKREDAPQAAEVAAGQPAEPVRERNRKLLSVSELEQSSIRPAAQFREDYYAQIEARLEELFEAYVAEKLSLAIYLDAIRHEKAKAHAILHNPKVWTEPDMREEAERAVAAVDWCLDWAKHQVASCSSGMAA